MIILGIILLILGAVFAVHLLFVLGIIAIVIGAILALVHFAGHRGPFIW